MKKSKIKTCKSMKFLMIIDMENMYFLSNIMQELTRGV